MTEAQTGRDNGVAAPPAHAAGAEPSSIHQSQYTAEIARFFDAFNRQTGRPELYYGYLAGCLSTHARNGSAGKRKERIAVDFGCGTGWLTPRLLPLGFSRVYGIDTSVEMLSLAFRRTSRDLATGGQLSYHQEIPKGIVGKCSLVTAVHVHYHFEPYEKLKTGFFGVIASLLEEKGEAILVGCPSAHIHNTPDHYQNSVHVKDIPEDVLKRASSPIFLADEEDYIPLSCLPPFALKDGAQMKVTFKAEGANGGVETKSLVDTFWSDEALTQAAEESGLSLIGKQNLTSGGHSNAYMMMHFRKTPTKSPAP